MIDIPFHKMQGAGNHFVVLDLFEPQLAGLTGAELSQLAQVLCRRGFGAGGDGMLTLEPVSALAQPESETPPTTASVRMRMWNPDGTEDMCGNGLRCVVALAWRRGRVSERSFGVETLAGLRQGVVLQDGRVEVTMGLPLLDPSQIPMTLPATVVSPREFQLPVGGQLLSGVTSLSTGSTHTVIFVDELPDQSLFAMLSPLIEHHPWFPERTSVLWTVAEQPDRMRVRIWERGVGETFACGTGACAVAVAAQLTGRGGRVTHVASRGGVLQVEWQPGREIVLTGPAQYLYQARWLGGLELGHGELSPGHRGQATAASPSL